MLESRKTTQCKFLVCVNEKKHTRTALRFACAKAKITRSNVEMLYVINPVDYNTIFSVADVIKEERKDDAEKLFTELSKEAIDGFGVKPEGIIREGLIADEIISHINDDSNITLLLLGAAGDGSSSKGGLISQLTNDIGNKFNIPLMIVPGNLTDQQIEELN